jgi:hypothetical protein
MFKVKRIVAIVLLLLVIGMGTPQVFAEGPSELPGVTNSGPSELPGHNGPSELPGIVNDIINLVASFIP